MIAHQPQDRVWTVLPARYRRVARALLALRLRQAGPWVREPHLELRVRFPLAALLARQLAGQHRIETLDALRSIAIGDCLHLEGMKVAELGDLIERQGGVLDEPDGGRLGHERCGGHGEFSSTLRSPLIKSEASRH